MTPLNRDVRFGSGADILRGSAHVRFAPKADIDWAYQEVRFVAKADIASHCHDFGLQHFGIMRSVIRPLYLSTSVWIHPTIFELNQTLELTRALVVGTGFTALAE